MKIGDKVVIDRSGLAALFGALQARGHRLVGPTVRGGAIVCDDIRSVRDLPEGWGEEQEAGRYRLVRRDEGRLFAHAASPQSWKKFLHEPRLVLWRARRDGQGFVASGAEAEPSPLALIGVRACDLQAIAIQDEVLQGGTYVDPRYRARRERAFIVAVACTHAGGTCFCVSMGGSPRPDSGFDLALTELDGQGPPEMLVETGSEAGARVLAELPQREAREADLEAARAATERTASAMGRTLNAVGLREALLASYDHPRWDEVGARCLACANCTMVCPTCFCSTVEDVTDLSGQEARRERRWDSCFGLDYSYIHGGSVRTSAGARYRQWLLHKLATWHDQFGTPGCVGCGRCITWCPVGIDITAEAWAIRATPTRARGGTDER